MYLKSLKIKIENLGLNHTSCAETYNNLAGIYQEQGKLNKAEEFQ